MSETLAGPYIDDAIEVQPIILDRSTLQRWAECPHMAAHIDSGGVSSGGNGAESGSEVHSVIAKAVAARHLDGTSDSDLRGMIEADAVRSRPDLQPDVVFATRKAYPIVRLICRTETGADRSPDDILRFDGGEGQFSGQLAADLMPEAKDGSRGPVRLTCEVDLLMATPSAEELEMYDWKSGWKNWTASEVATSFQFQFYAWVVFYNYPKVKRITVRVFMTRDGSSTSAVEFDREKLYPITQRLMTAAGIFLSHRGKSIEDVPAWPTPEKCCNCPAAPRCVVAHSPERDLATDPHGYLQQYIVLQNAADRMKATLSVATRKRGRDFVFEDCAFGADRPKTARAPTLDFYSPKTLTKGD